MSTWCYQKNSQNDVTIKLVFGIGIHVEVPGVKRVIHIGVPQCTLWKIFLGNWRNKMNGK